LEELILKIQNIEIRKRFWNRDPDQLFVCYLKLYGSQKEVEKFKDAVFKIDQEGS